MQLFVTQWLSEKRLVRQLKMREANSLAGQLFNAQIQFGIAEERVWVALTAVTDPLELELDDFTCDPYDDSIEIYGRLPVEYHAVIGKAMHDIGFVRVWVHDHPAPRGSCTCPLVP